MKRRLAILAVLVALIMPVRGLRAQGLDQYGGSLDLQCPNGATGEFYVQEIGNRWWLCDALGHAMWLNSAFNIWTASTAVSKYGSAANWMNVTAKRLKSWGFTATVDGQTFNAFSDTTPVIPTILFDDFSGHTVRDRSDFCRSSGFDPDKAFGRVFNTAIDQTGLFTDMADPFDPCFATYIFNDFRNPSEDAGYTPAEMSGPYAVGIAVAEADYIRGVKTGPIYQNGPTGAINTSPAGASYPSEVGDPNLGLTVLIGSPWITENTEWGRLYTHSREVYAKQELVNWLQGDGQEDIIAPASASSSSGVVTMTFQTSTAITAPPYSVGDKINVFNCSNAAFNGAAMAVQSASATTITYTPAAAGSASGITGCVAASVATAITGATLSGGTEVVTMGHNPFETGSTVTITGVTPSTFDTSSGTGCWVTAYTATTFTCTNGTGSATYTSGGVVGAGPGYSSVSQLNTAWGSNYTQFQSTGTHESVTISTSATPGACNRTTWVCSGTLTPAPDEASVWLEDNGSVVGGLGDVSAPNTFYGQLGVAYPGSSINFSTGAYSFTFPTSIQPGPSDTITLDYYSGGWQHGTGLMDEQGANAWAAGGNVVSLDGASMTNAFKNDMNDFTYHITAEWMRTVYIADKSFYPGLMDLGPNESSGNWCTAGPVAAMRAIGEYTDNLVLLGSPVCDLPTDQSAMDQIMKYLGNKAVIAWVGIQATPDSSTSYLGPITNQQPPNFEPATQAARGAEYQKMMNWFLNFQVDAGNGPASGQHSFIGINLWDGSGDDANQGNWGVETVPNDNPYDGYSARIARGTDQWGYPTGGEAANYGDFMTSVTNGNSLWLSLVPRQLVKTSSTP